MTATSRAIGTVLPARFPGFCRNCRRGYQRGELIRKAADKVWIHDACPNGERLPESYGTGYRTDEPVTAELITSLVRAELEAATLKVDEAEVQALIDADLERIIGRTRDELLAAGVVKQQLEIRLPNDDLRTVEGKAHASLPRCIRLAAARRNILLVGPAGSGKTHLASQVADALGLAFAHISCSAGMSEGQLTGRLLPIGEGGRFEYVRSDCRQVRAYRNGAGAFQAVCLKRPDQPVDIATLTNAVSGWCYRTVFFQDRASEWRSRVKGNMGISRPIQGDDPSVAALAGNARLVTVADVWSKDAAVAFAARTIESLNQ